MPVVYDDEKTDGTTKTPNEPEDLYGAPDTPESNSKKLSPDDLASAEDAHPQNDNDFDNERDKVGAGYTPNQQQSRRGFRGWFNKKRSAVLGGVLGTSIFGGFLSVMLIIPLKITSFVTLLDERASAAAMEAMDNMQSKLLSSYVRNNVINALDGRVCKSTISPKCTVVAGGDGPVKKMYKAWAQNKLEYRLATQHGIVISRNGTQLNMRVGNDVISDESFRQLRTGEIDITDLEGSRGSSRNEIRNTVRRAVENETRWSRAYRRYQYSRLLEDRYGIKRCLIACDQRDRFTDSVNKRKMAGKLWLSQRVGGVVGENYSLLFQCLSDTATCSSDLDSDDDGGEPRSRTQNELRNRLISYRSAHGGDRLSNLLSRADDLNKLGISAYITREVGVKLGEKLGVSITKEGVDKALGKAVPIVGWISLAIDIKNTLRDAPKLIKYAVYAANAASAVALFSVYQSAADEQKSGHTDAAQLGSLTETLSEGSEATSTPYYSSITNPSGSTSAFSSILALMQGEAHANTSDSTGYLCNDKKPVPEGKIVCEEEEFDNVGWIDTVYDIQSQSVISLLLRITELMGKPADWANALYKGVTGLVGEGVAWVANRSFMLQCNSVGQLYDCPKYVKEVQELMGKAIPWLVSHLFPNPFSNLTGGRVFDMMGAGSEVAWSKVSQANNGAGNISPEEYSAIQNRRIAREKSEFQSLSLRKRIFDTSNYRSLVAQMSLKAPNVNQAPSSLVATLLSSPVDKIAYASNSLVSTNNAFAAESPTRSPFGVPYTGYTQDQLAQVKDPDEYWTQYCEGRDFRKEWFDKKGFDQRTGEFMSDTPEPCMLIEAAAKAGGGMFDNSFNDPTGSRSTPPEVGDLGSADGYTFPLRTTRDTILNNEPKWCMDKKWTPNCHHDYPAADIFAPIGTEIVAMTGGELMYVKNNNTSVCSASKGGSPKVQIHGDDGKYYFYTHFGAGTVTAKPGKIKAGDKLGAVGPKECAQGTPPHLHIQWYNSVINGDSQSMDIQAPLLKSFEALPQ